MKTTRLLTVLGFATTLAINGCCGNKEQHAVTISTGTDALTVTRDGVARKVASVVRATTPPTSPPTFEFVYNTLQGNTIGDGIALSVSGDDPVTGELVTLSLALPMSLQLGEQYTVGATYTVEPGVPNAPGVFGAYDLNQPNQAESAFSVSTYTFPPGVYNTSFSAVASSGTIQVVERERGRLGLSLNLTFTDAGGKTVTVTGRVQAVTERFIPPCYD
ncbi:MAG: hypothetical protein ACJ78D_07040 [Gemmatimonadaceae bacterium]